MNHAFTLDDIKKVTKNYKEPLRAVGILIARPNIEIVKKQIITDINYFYHRSGKFIDFFLPGYGAYWYGHYPDEENVCKVDGVDWSYSDRMFCMFINELEKVSKWKYSGETELIILNTINGKLDFKNTLSIWLDKAIKDEAIYSIRSFLEDLIRISKSAEDAIDISSTVLLKSVGTSIINQLLEKIPFNSGKSIKKVKYFIKRDISLK